MKGRLSITLLFVTIIFFMQSTAFASPPPEEIQKAKENSPLHIIGTVQTDTLINDISEDRGYPAQIRKMGLIVEEIIKKPTDTELEVNQLVDIHYHYIPSWVEIDGSAPMDIVVGDKIEIWLEKDERGWYPPYSGSTVNHLYHQTPREEPLPEPRSSSKKITYTGLMLTFFFLFIVITLVLITYLMRSKP